MCNFKGFKSYFRRNGVEDGMEEERQLRKFCNLNSDKLDTEMTSQSLRVSVSITTRESTYVRKQGKLSHEIYGGAAPNYAVGR
jgi:hypothetical protein